MWVRGLKLNYAYICSIINQVAPYVGAWIETQQVARLKAAGLSHPMWVRGLKLPILMTLVVNLASHPMWVRGLKPIPLVLIYAK